jgi:hypothetical protein
MAGEILLINPRRRARKLKSAKRKVRRHRVRRKLAINPRSRVRVRSRRRIHRNPAFGGSSKGKLMQGVSFGLGAVVTKIGGGLVGKWIPAAWGLDANMARIGAEVAAGIVAPMLVKKFRFLPGNLTNAWLAGGIVVAVLDVFDTFVKPNLPMLNDYEYGQVSAYQENLGMIEGGGEESPYGDSVY